MPHCNLRLASQNQMNTAFIVTIDTDSTDPGHLQEDAVDIENFLTDGGFAVVSVAPWARHDGGTSSLSSIATALPTPNTAPITPIEPL